MKYLVVTMPDNTRWRIPARFIAEHRAAYYAKHDGDLSIIDDEVAYCLDDDYEIKDWAANNLNWSDVEAVAEKLPSLEFECDYQRAWVNADKKVVVTK